MLMDNVCTTAGKSALLFIAAALAGCSTGAASRIVEPGDRVAIHFTCSLPSGEVVAATSPDRAGTRPLAPIYLERAGNDPLVIEAGQESPGDPRSQRKSFELEIIDRLAGAVIGVKQGSSISLDLAAPRIAGLPAEEQYLKMSRVRKRAKEMKMPLAEYRERTGKEPAVGERYTFDPLVPGVVQEVAGAEVVIHFTAQPDREVQLPFGKGVIRERGDRYDIEISADKGSLIRAGGMVGRVTGVDADFIELDFGHPFGGETLHCEFTVQSAEPGEKKDGAPTVAELPGAALRTGKSL